MELCVYMVSVAWRVRCTSNEFPKRIYNASMEPICFRVERFECHPIERVDTASCETSANPGLMRLFEFAMSVLAHPEYWLRELVIRFIPDHRCCRKLDGERPILQFDRAGSAPRWFVHFYEKNQRSTAFSRSVYHPRLDGCQRLRNRRSPNFSFEMAKKRLAVKRRP